jgi:hypothetical protein
MSPLAFVTFYTARALGEAPSGVLDWQAGKRLFITWPSQYAMTLFPLIPASLFRADE